MEKGELDATLSEEIRGRVLGEGFMKIVQTVRRNGQTFRISMRPIVLGGEMRYQAEMVDGGQVRVKNLDANGAAEGLEEIIAQKGARDLHLMTASGDLHVRVTRKGRVMATRSATMDRAVKVQPHDRVKKTPLTSFDSAALLRVTGLADGEGKIRASMRGKYDQVNEFLKVVEEVVKDAGGGASAQPFTVVDCGCGKAYLTLALYFHLTQGLGFQNVCVVGVDRRPDVIAAAVKMAEQLDVADRVRFIQSDLASCGLPELSRPLDAPASPPLSRVDMVISLHACDTATDLVLGKAIEWKAKVVLSTPCCHHELNRTLNCPELEFIARHSLLRQKLCDAATDALRLARLEAAGYEVAALELIDPEETPKNVMLRGVRRYDPSSSRCKAAAETLKNATRLLTGLDGD